MYKVEFSNSAAKELEKIYQTEKRIYPRLIAAIESLQGNPYQGKSLKGKLQGDYSLRVGSYRIIYSVQKHQLIIYIIDIGHRREIYR